MNSRERVLAALEHRPVDRLPLGFFAVDHDTVSKVLGRKTYLRAKAKSQVALWEGRRDEVAQSWREDAIEFYSKVDLIDIIPVHAMASSVLPPADYEPERPERIAEGIWRDRAGRIYRYSPQTEDITCIEDPGLAGLTDLLLAVVKRAGEGGHQVLALHVGQLGRPEVVPERVDVRVGDARVETHLHELPMLVAAEKLAQRQRVVVRPGVAERLPGGVEEVLPVNKDHGTGFLLGRLHASP